MLRCGSQARRITLHASDVGDSYCCDVWDAVKQVWRSTPACAERRWWAIAGAPCRRPSIGSEKSHHSSCCRLVKLKICRRVYFCSLLLMMKMYMLPGCNDFSANPFPLPPRFQHFERASNHLPMIGDPNNVRSDVHWVTSKSCCSKH